jgi:hypothetical protein
MAIQVILDFEENMACLELIIPHYAVRLEPRISPSPLHDGNRLPGIGLIKMSGFVQRGNFQFLGKFSPKLKFALRET